MLEFKEICKNLGWKFTCQRYAVYRFMNGNRIHPTTDFVREKLLPDYPAISRDSVFRILNDFAEAGLIARMEFTDPVRFDGNTKRHNHFFCKKCGMVIDCDFNPPSEEEFSGIGNIHTLEIRATGICKQCMNEKGSVH